MVLADTRIANSAVHDAINSDEWTAGEKAVIKWQFRLYGSFYTNLFDAIQSADYINLQKLRLGFPDEVEGFLAWRDGSLANRIDEVVGL